MRQKNHRTKRSIRLPKSPVLTPFKSCLPSWEGVSLETCVVHTIGSFDNALTYFRLKVHALSKNKQTGKKTYLTTISLGYSYSV